MLYRRKDTKRLKPLSTQRQKKHTKKCVNKWKMAKTQAKHVPVFGVLVMVLLMITTYASAGNPKIDGLDESGARVFTAQGNTFEVINVARKTEDTSKYISMKFSLVNGPDVGCEIKDKKSETNLGDKKRRWQLSLCDDTALDVVVQTLGTTLPIQEVSVTWPGNTKTQTETRELCFTLDKDAKWYV